MNAYFTLASISDFLVCFILLIRQTSPSSVLESLSSLIWVCYFALLLLHLFFIISKSESPSTFVQSIKGTRCKDKLLFISAECTTSTCDSVSSYWGILASYIPFKEYTSVNTLLSSLNCRIPPIKFHSLLLSIASSYFPQAMISSSLIIPLANVVALISAVSSTVVDMVSILSAMSNEEPERAAFLPPV